MEGAGGTASLRKAAAHWTLAGDKQLLDLLQNLHERIVTKCQETNSGLEEMVNTLDTASISLQNVNNRLMALSNSQFVESRVYDDDVDVATSDAPVKEPPKAPEPVSELSKLRDSLRVLEAYHEPVHIVDSDSDSTSDDEEDRMVFKPKDLFSDRPLPYIIGSQQWRSKWHAGLVAEDSETDSDTSKQNAPSEQYSDSEPERDGGAADAHASQRTISTNSSIGSELTVPTAGKPADIAAELARRLGGAVPHVPEPRPEPDSPPAAPPTVYRPQQPTTATIFPDEPPPLDACQLDQSDQSDEPDQSDSEDDVFAELHRGSRRQPARGTSSVSGAVDQLFEDVHPRKGGFDDVDKGRQPNPSAKSPSPLFEEPQDSELFADKTKSGQRPVHSNIQAETSVKKPIGGISPFGTNYGAESIGAAILKRNQIKSSNSQKEIEPQETSNANNNTNKNKVKAETGQIPNNDIQKDIINDLFTKPNKTKQTKKVEQVAAVKVEKPVNKKVDLFTDDLFDDIDDIFTNVKPPAKETKETVKKSLFDDDDDDDLFGNVAASNSKTSSKLESKNKSIFDSDDDLFNENNVEIVAKSNKTTLDDSSDGSRNKESVANMKITEQNVAGTQADRTATETEKSITTKRSELVDNIANRSQSDANYKEMKGSKVKSIFDSDSDDGIFLDLKPANNDSSNIQKNKSNILYHIDKVDINAESHSQNNDSRIDEKNELDDSLFKKIETPKDGKKFSTPEREHNDIKNSVNIDRLEDNSKKTDQVFTESPEIESDKNISVADKIFSGKNINESRIQDKEISSVLSNTNVHKTQFHSPSLFDDDDLEDLFTKSSDSKTKEIDDKVESNLSRTSELTVNEDMNDSIFSQIEESNETYTEIINKTDVPSASTKNDDSVHNVHESQISKSEDTEKPLLTNAKPEVLPDISEDFEYQADTNDNFEEPEIPSDDNIGYSIPKPKESVLHDSGENKTENDNLFTDVIHKELKTESVPGEPDVFGDIFSDVPPEFERPKEPKRSKNVNALFDDDSDDEALFFKKNETVNDEKPDVSFSGQDDRLFHIFHDEPPAMDVDFTQKSKRTLDSDLEIPTDEIFSEVISSPIEVNERRTWEKQNNLEKTQKEPSSSIDSESEKIIDDFKKPVGKLKPMSFNINVNTLLPGASPKKNKPYEQVDGQVISTKSTEDFVKNEESTIVKSVSFEGDPENEVLDNKLSKERAKIQVKRRPSSRRARKEAVRKSGIDFGDDSTDNSSSTEISRKDTPATLEKLPNTSQKDDILVDSALTKDVGNYNADIADENNITDSSEVLSEKHDVEQDKLFNSTESNIAQHTKPSEPSPSDAVTKEVNESSNLTTAFNTRPNVKSKVVYILNDEDIFTTTKPVSDDPDNNKKIPQNTQSIAKNKVLNIVDDDDELFKAGTSKNNNITTLGTVYKDVNQKNNEIDNFDSDEDIFKASQSKLVKDNKPISNKDDIDKIEAKIDKLYVKTQNTKVKSSLFDDLSDDESELFGGKKNVKSLDVSDKRDGISTIIKKEVNLPKTDKKRSLFGDESDDDDLFGVRTTKKEPSQRSSKPKEVASRPTEPVFADPLSMLGQEDDI